MKISNWLAAAAAAHPQRTALVSRGGQLTYSQLRRRVERASSGLAGLGVSQGDRVATTLAGADLVVLTHAVLRLGAAIAPLDPNLTLAELEPITDALAPVAVVSNLEQVEQMFAPPNVPPPPLGLDDVLCVIHSSGTGGAPKAIELTYGNHLWSAVGCGMRIGMQPSDRWLCCLPMHHIGGFAIAIRCAIYGATAIVERFEAARTAETLRHEDVTIVSLVATMLDRLLERGDRFGDLRCALLGGGPAPESLVERAVEASFPVAPTYGMTETCSQVTTLAPGEVHERPGSAGRPLAAARVRVGEDGRIAVSGPTVGPALVDEGGWLQTADLGRLDEDGFLYVLGRADQVIVTGGENVSPEEVESVLVEHPAVADVAVFGRDDLRWQNAVVAAVVMREGEHTDADGLNEFCRARLSGFKIPKQFEFVPELPRNEQGKLLRARLR
ncbi:MAG: AMP-binding protein [Phycisphaeraceae bacterium]